MKVAYLSEMARNKIENDFRASKMIAFYEYFKKLIQR